MDTCDIVSICFVMKKINKNENAKDTVLLNVVDIIHGPLNLNA